jgi:hypothetical protein
MQNVMTFNKCSINGQAYGDVYDQYGRAIDITEVKHCSFSFAYSTVSSCVCAWWLWAWHQNVFIASRM